VLPLLAATLASSVLLHVAIHVDAGTIQQIAADDAAGQCALGPSWLSCPAGSEPVHFRWGPGGEDWVLTGDTTLAAGQQGTALVLPPDRARADALARLAPDVVTEADIRDLFVRDGDHVPDPPSAGMLTALYALRTHPDKLVRRAMVEGMQPLCHVASLGPFPPDAPCPIPDDLLTALAKDKDKGARRRVAVLVRDLRPSHLDAEAGKILKRLAVDPVRGVRRAAMVSVARAPISGALDAEAAWCEALANVPQPGPPGRAACNTLARLAHQAGPSETIDPSAAIALVLDHHPERAWRVWTAWRDAVPFRRDWVDLLLRRTLGFSPRLLALWVQQDPDGLADAMHAWEPAEPHSERYGLIARAIADAEPTSPALADVVQAAAPPPEAPQPEPTEDR